MACVGCHAKKDLSECYYMCLCEYPVSVCKECQEKDEKENPIEKPPSAPDTHLGLDDPDETDGPLEVARLKRWIPRCRGHQPTKITAKQGDLSTHLFELPCPRLASCRRTPRRATLILTTVGFQLILLELSRVGRNKETDFTNNYPAHSQNIRSPGPWH